MAENLSMALAELLRKADAEPDSDTLREGVRVMTQELTFGSPDDGSPGSGEPGQRQSSPETAVPS